VIARRSRFANLRALAALTKFVLMTANLASARCAVKSFFGFFWGGVFVVTGAVPEPPLQYWRLSTQDSGVRSQDSGKGKAEI
jgi:hypothetical protein